MLTHKTVTTTTTEESIKYLTIGNTDFSAYRITIVTTNEYSGGSADGSQEFIDGVAKTEDLEYIMTTYIDPFDSHAIRKAVKHCQIKKCIQVSNHDFNNIVNFPESGEFNLRWEPLKVSVGEVYDAVEDGKFDELYFYNDRLKEFRQLTTNVVSYAPRRCEYGFSSRNYDIVKLVDHLRTIDSIRLINSDSYYDMIDGYPEINEVPIYNQDSYGEYDVRFWWIPTEDEINLLCDLPQCSHSVSFQQHYLRPAGLLGLEELYLNPK